MKLKPSLSSRLLPLSGSSCFVAIGLFLIAKGDLLVGWFSTGFFGLCSLVGLISLLPGSNYLDLGKDGMEIRSLYRKWHVRWVDVQEFFPISVARRPMVCWRYVSSYSGQRVGRKISSGITGVEAGLPDTYGMSAQALSKLLNEWRIEHAVLP